MSNESKDSEQNKETYSENNYNKDPLNDVIDVDNNKNKTVIIKQTKESEKALLSQMNHLSIKKNSNNPTYQITINNINNIYQTPTQQTLTSNNISLNEKDFTITNSPIKSSSHLKCEPSDLVVIPEGKASPSMPKVSKDIYLKYKKPYAFLWSPIPFISTILPFIGHISVCSSNGTIHDFFSSKYISLNQINYGAPYKYINLELKESEMREWDRAIVKADKKYKRKIFSFCGNNSLKYAAFVLGAINYNGKSKHSKCDIIKLGIRKSKFFSNCDVIKTYIGFVLIIVCIILIIILVVLN